MRLLRHCSLLVLLIIALLATSSAIGSDEALQTTDDLADDDVILLNSDYVGPPKDEDSESDESDSDQEETDPKSLLAKALEKSRKAPLRTIQFAKKNRTKIMIAVALFAFRRELGQLLLRLFTTKVVDPETGEVVSRTVHVNATAILKLILFVDLMRRKGDSSPNAFLMGPHGLFLTPFFSKLMNANTAYVPPVEQHWTFERVNERYDKDRMAFQKALATTASTPLTTRTMDFRQAILGSMRNTTHLGASNDTSTSLKPLDTVILMDLTGLTQSVDQMGSLRDQVSFLLTEHRAKQANWTQVDSTILDSNSSVPSNNTKPDLEIVVLLESPGGSAADYGLAAEQILRLRHEPGIQVTICVDKVAASGGYMIACTSSPGCLFAAPFAVLGSIGVIGTSINIHNVLQGWGVQPLVFRGGKDKAPVGLIGEVTKEGIAKVQSMVDSTHVAFKRHVVTSRPTLTDTIDGIATGDVWLGCDALGVGLIDRVVTSDQYIGERLREGARVLRLVRFEKPRFPFSTPHAHLGLSHPMNVMKRSIKAFFVDFPVVLSRLSSTLDESALAEQSGLSAVTRSFAACAVQASAQL